MAVRKFLAAVCGAAVVGAAMLASAGAASAQQSTFRSPENPAVTDPAGPELTDDSGKPFGTAGDMPCPVSPTVDFDTDAALSTPAMKPTKSLRPRHPNAPLVTDGFIARDDV